MALETPAKEEKILVSVRLRPLNDKEKAKNDVSDWCVTNNTVMYNNSHPDRSMSPSAYSFDRVFGWDCSTRQVYDEGAKEVALSVINGINSTIFAYGQTSSGKTYTMNGITEYAVADIYDYIEKYSGREFVSKFSAMEIYNEAVKDLLSSEGAQLRLLDDPEKGTIVEKLSEEVLRDRNHLQELLSICAAQRKIGETSLNETSSRSHQILRLTIESSTREYLVIGSSRSLAATVNFVDLAGSERVAQALSAGARLKEGCHINRSLLTLGNVIRKLSKGRNGHIPYRDSKLTRILQNSLGGNARTAIICTMSPARSHVEQSKNTLFFASCAKEVTTNAKVNVVTSDKALVKQLQKELAKMEDALRSLASNSMKEKELLLEQMDKEIKELTQQRDLAQSRVQNMLQSVGEGQVTRIGENSRLGELLDMPSFPNSSEHNRQLSESSDENFLLASGAPMFARLDPRQGWEDIAQRCHAESEDTAQRSHAEYEDIAQSVHAESENIAPKCLVAPKCCVEPEDARSPAESEDIVQRCHSDSEDIAQRSQEESEDNCKEIRCIQTEESFLPGSEQREGNFVTALPMHEDAASSSQTEPMNEGAASSSQAEYKELSNANAEYEALQKKIQEMQKTIERLSNLGPVEQSPCCSESSSGNLGLSRSRSCKAVVMSPPFSFPSKEVEQNENASPAEGSRQRLSKSKNGINSRNSSREDFQFSALSGAMDTDSTREQPESEVLIEQDIPKKLKAYRQEISRARYGANSAKLYRKDYDQESLLSVKTVTEEKREPALADDIVEDLPRSSKGLRWKLFNKSNLGSDVGRSSRASSQVASVLSAPVAWKVIPNHSESELEDNVSVLNFADERNDEMVREAAPRRHRHRHLDSVPRGLRKNTDWRSEFERHRGLIIELWDACFVPLVHRTHFFLLYKGDPSDFLYLEVELRRLSILKETFSEGSNVKSRQAPTPAASVKALKREREMLSKKVPKRFTSKKEKERLYQKWGIRLNTKQRSLQLANLLWTSTMDMGHIRESAALVAKLVGLVEPLEGPKEILGLSFLSRPINKRSSIWGDSMSTL